MVEKQAEIPFRLFLNMSERVHHHIMILIQTIANLVVREILTIFAPNGGATILSKADDGWVCFYSIIGS